MTPATRRFLPSAALFFSLVSLAHAHPGHDGHELTWDLQHLADHPLATLLCAGIIAVTAWGVWRARRYVQSLRASQLKRGK